jgi:hypothetical protein
MNIRLPFLAAAALCACVALPSLAAGTRAKAGSGTSAEAQAQYKRDLALCDSNRATEDRSTCRTEAQRAYAEARAGNFAGTQDQYARNARARCEALKGSDRTACEERMGGQGNTSGSVGGGGILRERTTPVPAR